MADQQTIETVLERLERMEEGMNRIQAMLERQYQDQVCEKFRITQEWYSVQEFAVLTGLTPGAIHKRCQKGLYQTHAHVTGHKYRIHYRHVIEHVESTGQEVEMVLKKVKRQLAKR